MDDDFNNQRPYDSYGEQINSDIGNSLAKAASNSIGIAGDLHAYSKMKEEEEEQKKQDSDNELGEDTSEQKDDELGEEGEEGKHDELGEGNKEGDELGEETKKEKEDELGEDADDSDGDGTPDSKEDSDGDGTPDSEENDNNIFDKDGDDDSPINGDGKGKLGSKIKALKLKLRVLKIKIILILVGLILVIFLVGGIIGGIASTWDSIVKGVSKFADEVVETGGKLINLITLKGFNTEEEAFSKSLLKQYEDFKIQNGGEEIQGLDIALLSATIHYNTLVSNQYYDEDERSETQKEYLNGEFFLNEETAGSFYTWANDELGNFNTLVLQERGLVGALVSDKLEGRCRLMTFVDNLNSFLSSLRAIANRIGSTAWASLQDLQGYSLFEAIDTYYAYVKTGRTSGVVDYLNGIIDKNEAQMQSIGYEFGYDIDSVLQYTALPTCPKVAVAIEGTCNTSSEDCFKEGETYYVMKKQIAYYQRKVWNDYEKYDNYLKSYYIPRYFIDCENCVYKTADETKKAERIDYILKDIYTLRDYYYKLLNLDERSTGNFGTCAAIGVRDSNFYGVDQCGKYVYQRVTSFLEEGTEARNRFSQMYARDYAANYYYNNMRLGSEGFATDMTPSAGSIAVWSGGGSYCSYCGHVAFVEDVLPDGTLYATEVYGSTGARYDRRMTQAEFEGHVGRGYRFLGYIHVINCEGEEASEK